jgi:hypothetical protein
MFPFLDTSACPLLPSRGSRPSRFPTFIGTMRGVRPLSFRPGPLLGLGVRYLFREMLLRSVGRRISAVPAAWPVRVGGCRSRRAGGRESRALPGSWRIPLKARPGLETPAASGVLAYRSPGCCLPRLQRRRHPQRSYDFGAESARLASSLSTLHPASRPARCKTRYRPARYGFDRIGLSPTGLERKVSLAHRVSSFPRFILAR